jgi:ribose 5-phosphate isomerase RpiB
LDGSGIAIDSQTSDCLIDATDRLAAEIAKSNTLGLLWTRHTAAGMCLTNRHPGVRAVLASDVPATAEAIGAVGANLLVLDPTANTVFQQKQIVGEFCRGGVRGCPESLKPRLA